MGNCAGKYDFNGVTLTSEQLYELQLKAIKQLNQERHAYLNQKSINSESIVEALKRTGYINLELYKKKFLRVPRGRFASDKIELQALREIERTNKRIKDEYGVDDDLLVTVKTEKGYNIRINEHVVKQANYNLEKMQNRDFTQAEIQDALTRVLFERDDYMEMGADQSVKRRAKDKTDTPGGKVNMILVYKKSLLALMNNQLASVVSKLKSGRRSDSNYEELKQLEQKLILRIRGNGIKAGEEGAVANLTDEIKDLESLGENVRPLAFDYMIRDLMHVDTLLKELEDGELTEKHLINLTQIQIILSPFELYENSTRTNKDNPLFTNAEWNLLRTGGMTLPALVQLKDKADRELQKIFNRQGLNYISRFNKVQEKLIERIADNDDRVKELFGEESIKYSRMFKGAMKDLSLFDKLLGDNVVGTFTDYGPVPQIMRNLLERVITKYMSKHTVWEEHINAQQKEVHEELEKLGFGLGPFGMIGVNYKIFRQTANNVKLDGNKTVTEMNRNLVQRHSYKFADRFQMVKDAYWTAKKETTNFDKRKTAYLERNNWLRKNTVLVDPRKLAKIRNNPDFQEYSRFFIEDEGHEQELKRHLQSDVGLQEVISEQEKKIYDYIADYKRFVKNILSQAGVDSVDQLNVEYVRLLRLYDAEHNPFLAAKAFSMGLYTKYEADIRFPEMSTFNSFVPRRFTVKSDAIAKETSNGELVYDETGEDTGYYDKNFPTIENNPVLKKFYELTKNLMEETSKMIPPDMQEELTSNMFNSVEKTFGGILLDSDVHVWKRIVPAMKKLYDNALETIRVHKQSKDTGEIIDAFKNTISPKVRVKYIATNTSAIQNKFAIQSRLFVNTLSDSLISNFDKIGFTKASKVSLTDLSPNAKAMVASWLGVKNSTAQIMDALNLEKPTDLIPVGRLLHKFVTSQVVADETFNLPKILKLYSQGATNYAAMNEALPMINVLKEHYNNIAKPALTNAGEQKQKQIQTPQGDTITVPINEEQKRSGAVDNMEKWYQRNVLGNVNPQVWGLTDKKILTSKEKELYQQAQDVIDKEYKLHPEAPNMAIIEKMRNIQASLGGELAISALVDQLLNFSRFLGLGLNPVGAIKNYLAGKLSNFINGLTGYYYTEDSMWRAEHAVLSSHANLGFGIAKTKGARKIAVLMTRFKVFQDATDEIYKSSINGAVKYQSNLSWYFLQQRVEYVNQSPVLIAMLMDQKIQGKDKNGNVIESSVWDAMKNDGTFIEGFDTEENNKTWVNTETTEFTNFKSRVDGAIKNIHGDYTTIGAPADSGNQLFRAFMMFKRWMVRYAHTRIAEEHFDSELGVKFKGRFRNYDSASLSAVAVTMAFTFAGVNIAAFGLAIGAGVIGGAYLSSQNAKTQREKDGEITGTDDAVDGDGNLTPVNTPRKDENSAQNFFEQSMFYLRDFGVYVGELGLYGAQIAAQAVVNPVKIAVNTIGGGNYIKNPSFVKAKSNSQSDIQQQRDIQANLTEMSFILTALMLRLIALKLFKMGDDDDEEKEDDETAINTLINMAGAMINEISQFYNPITTATSVLQPAFIRLSTNTWKLIQALGEFNNVYVSGPYSGRSKVGVWAEKVLLPAAFRTKHGFDTQGRQIYDKFGIEKNFVPVEKQLTNEITQVRSKFKATLTKELTVIYGTKEAVLLEADKMMKGDPKLSKDKAVKLANRLIANEIDKAVIRVADQYAPTLSGYTRNTPLPELAKNSVIADNPGKEVEELNKIYVRKYQQLIEQHLHTVEESINDGTVYNDIMKGELQPIKK